MFDAEAAWADLAALIETRPGWGPDRLLGEMRKLETKHHLAEGLLSRVLRVYGGRFTLVINEGEAVPAGALGAVPLAAEDDTPPPIVRGGRDGRRNGRNAHG